MKLGTHNSMSYLPPKKWYLYPFRFIARCQSKSIEEQYEKYGVRMFDLRITFKNLVPEFRHGLIAYKGSVEDTIKYLNSLNDKIYVRLTLETSKEDTIQEGLFTCLCSRWKTQYKNIKFFNGRRKFDWKQIYNFGTKEPKITQLISSMTWKKWDDWFPYLYARIMNKKNISNYKKKDWLLIDFINIK